MRSLTATELLIVWENGASQTKIERALSLLSVACSIADLEIIARWSIARRDGRLFRLRAWMFGDNFTNTARCPQCSEEVEWEMNLVDFPLPALQQEEKTEIFPFTIDDYHIKFRLPNSEDLRTADPAKILDACLLEIKKQETTVNYGNLPEAIKEALSREMEKANPLAHISILLNCPSCQYQWEATFDIVSYFWTEINHWANRLLQDVFILARAFGWSEREILNLSPRRRQFYLDMLGDNGYI